MSFQGNESLRHAKEPVIITDEQQKEILRCNVDPEYFFRNYVKIVNLDEEKLVLFEPRKYQLDFMHLILDNRFTIAKWARQSGKTTIVAAILLHMILSNRNYRILVIAHKHEKAIEILDVVKQMYESLPTWLQLGVKAWGAKSIRLGNGSFIKTAGTSGSSGRGGTFHFLYLDEFAFVPTHLAEDFFRSAVPSISSGKETKIAITSTPKGLNFFYKLWNDSEKGVNEYNRSEIRWWDVPGRDENWKQKIIDSYGEQYFRQEFNSEFIGSSLTLISGDKLRELVWSKPLIQTADVSIYAEPIKDHIYAVTVDVGEGIGQDFSVATCFDITELPYQAVAFWRSNITTSLQLPAVLYNMGKRYNEAMVIIENASEGGQVANMLHYDLDYPYVLSTSTKTKLGQSISGGFGGNSRFGVKMTTQVKRIGCATLKTLIEGNKLVINDHILLQELFRFVQQGKSFEADEGHDDHVMCCVLFAWLVDQGYIRDLTSVQLRKSVALEYEQTMVDLAAPIIFQRDNQDQFTVEQREIIQSQKAKANTGLQYNKPDPEPDPYVQEMINRLYGK